ncbi:MAG: DUF5343 domain-containing protein [Desulfomonile tiedjei]|nr:DUF5343 domain-containing protein [Desulfomonile tiedjei]
MGLTNKYSVASGRLPDLFVKIRDGQAPEYFSQQLLKDWGFTSSHDRAAIPLLKELGFLSPDGKPTSRYHDYRDHSRSRAVMADALRGAYGDLFLIKEHPAEGDKDAIHGKFRSFHNISDNVAGWMTKTFYTLLGLSDLKAKKAMSKDAESKDHPEQERKEPSETDEGEGHGKGGRRLPGPGLHYNIQIHLPASKDVEVYNAIFKSLREHLLED